MVIGEPLAGLGTVRTGHGWYHSRTAAWTTPMMCEAAEAALARRRARSTRAGAGRSSDRAAPASASAAAFPAQLASESKGGPGRSRCAGAHLAVTLEPPAAAPQDGPEVAVKRVRGPSPPRQGGHTPSHEPAIRDDEQRPPPAPRGLAGQNQLGPLRGLGAADGAGVRALIPAPPEMRPKPRVPTRRRSRGTRHRQSKQPRACRRRPAVGGAGEGRDAAMRAASQGRACVYLRVRMWFLGGRAQLQA